ncbi:hypothetical protein TNCV_2668251 [Trichonephila clavipes]|nr:hypothetical protein TNCV_2668251 [Trichonephila clavipes]
MNSLSVSGKSVPAWKMPPQVGQRSTTRTPENSDRVKQLVENDRPLIKRMLAEQLGTCTDRVRLILTQNLGK